MLEVPVQGGSRGAHVDGSDDTARHCVRGSAMARFWKNPGLAHYKNTVM